MDGVDFQPPNCTYWEDGFYPPLDIGVGAVSGVAVGEGDIVGGDADVSESDIRQAGLAVSKRSYSIYKQNDYEATLIVAALRGTYHMTELAGAEIIMSIAPPYQEMLLSEALPFEERIDYPVSDDVIKRLSTLPEFVRAYEPEGMEPKDFITYGVVQKTLAQFYEGGWKLLENFQMK